MLTREVPDETCGLLDGSLRCISGRDTQSPLSSFLVLVGIEPVQVQPEGAPLVYDAI